MNLGYVQVTRRCNQTCRICSNPELDATIDTELACDLIDEMMAKGYDGVILTGGEPTIHPELPTLIRHAKDKGFHVRIITNGQRLSDSSYADEIIRAGLDLAHVSLLSHRAFIQNWLTGNEASFERVTRALDVLSRRRVALNINIPIHHYNANALVEMVGWILERWPGVEHFVFDLLDPQQNRASQNVDVIPALWEVRIPLKRTLDGLERRGKTFRVERLPLCAMTEFAHCSTETRKIVQQQDRLIHFLDDKRTHRKERWVYGKAACCSSCDFDSICAGLWEMDRTYSSAELVPIRGSREAVIGRILKRGHCAEPLRVRGGR